MDKKLLEFSTIKPEVLAEVDEVIASYEDPVGHLMMILNKAQKINGYLPPALQLYIASKLDIPASKVNGIVSFYSLFVEEPEGRFSVAVCMGTACFVKSGDKVLAEFRKQLDLPKGKKISDDGMFSLIEVRCIGACGLAPVVRVNDKIYGHVKPEEVAGIIEECRKKAKEEDDAN